MIDAEGAKENARRAREKKKEAARRAAAAVEKERVFSVEEVSSAQRWGSLLEGLPCSQCCPPGQCGLITLPIQFHD